MALGMVLLSRMTVSTTYGQAVFNIVVMGLGLGVTMPVFTIAVQNAVPYQVMSIATSTAQFFRVLGGTLSLGILGSVMTSRFASELTSSVSPGVKEALSPGQLSSLAHNPQALMISDARSQLQSQFNHAGPQGAGLFGQLLDTLRHALSSAISEVFLIGLIMVVIAWLIVIFLKEVPLQGRMLASSEMTSPQPDQEKTAVS